MKDATIERTMGVEVVEIATTKNSNYDNNKVIVMEIDSQEKHKD